MVYESDFYTTRRPYSRPTVTSYSVTNPRLTPAVGKAQTYHPSIPFIAHKKLTNVTTPVPHNSVRKTVIGNTLDRIQHKPRSQQSYDPMEDFLNERSVTSFEDVTRSIRANTAALLKKVHTPIPRSVKPLSVTNLYNYTETPVADRISSDEYIWHLLRPLPGKPSNGIDVGYYPESSTRIPLGKTHLACLSYAGGHPIAKRRQLVAGPGDDFRNVRNDVELLSHYTRMRQAANQPHENGVVSNDASSQGASRFKYNASTTPHTTEKVITNGSLSASSNDDDKENIVASVQKPLKKKPSKDISIDEDQNQQKDEEKALREKQAEEERLERERKAEQERLEQERIAEEERLEAERKAEEERIAEEERLEQERRAEEERLAKEEEEKQRLLEEKLVEEYHREQERLAEEKRQREQELAEEQQRLAQQKLAEEQKILHEKLMEIKQQQEAEEDAEKDEEEEDEEAEKSQVVIEEVEEKDGEYASCNNIPKDSYETDKKNESAEEESEEASDEEPAIAENVQQNGNLEVDEVVVIRKTVRSTAEYEEHFETATNDKDDEKSENTDANSDISEAEEEPNNSTVPELNNAENKDNEKTQNEFKENKEEEEESGEEEDDEEEEEEEE